MSKRKKLNKEQRKLIEDFVDSFIRYKLDELRDGQKSPYERVFQNRS